MISGGSDVAVLYGAYRFAEKLGVRFYLHGDVIPDERIAYALPHLNETATPLFTIRGIQPFHDFPEGPDWWDQDDYLAYVEQLPKMRMNFLGLHCYPEGGVGPEPLVWIGSPSDCDERGGVKFSYPSAWANTTKGTWGYAPVATSEFAGGAALLFAQDGYGNYSQTGLMPRPATPTESNELFRRVGEMMRIVFSRAKQLGVKTCVGTETPLTIPTVVRERLKALGRDPGDPNTVQEIYEGIFMRISRACPVDYYWLWTPEDWTWGGNSKQRLDATTSDIRAALAALQCLGNPFVLATCGWVLGPQNDRTALDRILPKTSPMSCINRQVGHDPVEPAFADIAGRPKWAIPWMENDPMLTQPQPWVARMRYDAADARRLGCTGLLGIHWRTKAMMLNVSALSAAAWDQSWVPANFFAKSWKPQMTKDGAVGGNAAVFTEPVTGTEEVGVYQTVRYDMDGYRLSVPNGTYRVRLQFNEPFHDAIGKRVFGVRLQGKTVIDTLDVFKEVGRNKALDYVFHDIEVSADPLRIEFVRQVEFPCIAGIVIEGRTNTGTAFSRKINCGGGKVEGYEADTVVGAIPSAGKDRGMPDADFYKDFARANFGAGVAVAAAAIMASVDGLNMPKVTDWITGPGGILPNGVPWETVQKQFAFVESFAKLRSRVRGAGNLERFDYWLNTYRAVKAIARVGCLRAELDRAAAALKNETDTSKRKQLASDALVSRVAIARAWEELMTYQAAACDTPGELGTIANFEMQSRRTMHTLDAYDNEITAALERPLPLDAAPSNHYAGATRIVVPTVRTQARKGESLALRVAILDNLPASEAYLCLRPLGKGQFQRIELRHLGRAVYQATLPAAQEDFEYYIVARTADGKKLLWPATAPKTNQTVIVD